MLPATRVCVAETPISPMWRSCITETPQLCALVYPFPKHVAVWWVDALVVVLDGLLNAEIMALRRRVITWMICHVQDMRHDFAGHKPGKRKNSGTQARLSVVFQPFVQKMT